MTMQNATPPGPAAYRIQQLGPPRDRDGSPVRVHGQGTQLNEPVTGFDSLVLHHPGDSRGVRMVDGSIVGGERGRVFAYVGGRIEEIEFPRPVGGRFRDYGLATDQVLIKKDFILSHPDRDPGTRHGRRVHVPAPVAGVVGARRDREGLVDIFDRRGGEVIARIRHMSDIEVDVGDAVEYGQTLGIQSDVDTRRIHVHMEMDSRYYLQFRNYVDDLASGRLPVDAVHRTNVQPRPVPADGTFRLGASDPRIRDLQRVMDGEGYRAADGGPLDRDGVYRIGMQGALLDFQRDHGIRQTGDIDPPTLRFAPATRPREVDRLDYVASGRTPQVHPSQQQAPGHPDHPDHRPGLPAEPEPAVNQRRAQAPCFGCPPIDRLSAALRSGDEAEVSLAFAAIGTSPEMLAMLERGNRLLAAAQEDSRSSQQIQAQPDAPVRG